jgi:uncharacterized protein (DUF486 family)
MNAENYFNTFSQIEKYLDYQLLDVNILRFASLFQIFRGAFFALILFPFYNTIIKSNYAWLKLFLLIWGFSLIGSVAPIPGSIEGLIYTDLSLSQHLIAAVKITIQIFVFSWFFVKWENRTERDYS